MRKLRDSSGEQDLTLYGIKVKIPVCQSKTELESEIVPLKTE